MRKIQVSENYKKDLKKLRIKNYDESSLNRVVKLILGGKKLPDKYDDHPLSAKYIGYRDCHIDDDLVLIYKNTKKSLLLERTGTHSDLFG